jgi:chromosome segregation ATPase
VQDKLEDQEKQLKKELNKKEDKKTETELELNRYKDLLSLREKEIDTFKKVTAEHAKMTDGLNKKINYLEKEKKDLSKALIKHQRGISPFKVQSRSQY